MGLEQVGFIHCSWPEQLAGTHRRFYADLDPDAVLLLEINPAQLDAPMRADASPTGELFPHLYGPLPLEAVTHVAPYPLKGT